MAASELVSGTLVGARYRLERVLGEGGMGVVWAATELLTNELYALKLLKDDVEDPDARRRFGHEARAAQAVRHPNVVTIHGVIELEDERPAIVMELLHGETLRDVLSREHRLALAPLIELLAPVIAAVGAAHAQGVVHRDLKPENIFLARQPTGSRIVKILDFGIAKVTALDGETMRTTGLTTGKVLGTPAYMAPEQVYGQTDLDHRVDVWALGLVLYQALSGVLPTHGDNIGQVFRNVTARPFPPLDELAPGTPPEVTELVARMLARERADRPQDLREVIELLDGICPSTWQPFGPPAASLLAVGAAAHRPSAASPRPAGAASAAGQAPAQGASSASASPSALPGSAGSSGSAGTSGSSSDVVVSEASTGPATKVSPLPTSAQGPWQSGVVRTRGARARLAWIGGAAALVAAGAIAGTIAAVSGGRSDGQAAGEPGETGRPPLVPGSSPLAAPQTKLACPVWRATGAEAPAGWLGAAGAAVACERARVLLGGEPERTLVPAELLDLPRGPADTFPVDPYGAPDARARSVAAAQQRAAAYLDGEVTWSAGGFTVGLSLHRADGSVLANASGRGRGLYEAVRAAMAPLRGPALIPQASELVPAVASWARTTDPVVALAGIDLTMAFAHNAGGLPEECQRFAPLGAAELGAEGRWLCAYVLGRPAPKVELPAGDLSAAAVATRLRIDYLVHRVVPPGAAQRLQEIAAGELTPRGRALAAVSASCLLGATDARAARELAIVAVQSEPKNPEGGLCNPWEQLVTLERDTAAAEGTLRAMQAWVPWNSYAWLEAGFADGARADGARSLVRRAYLLSPYDTQVADTLAVSELTAGDRSAARGIALALRGGGLPLHQVASDLLLVRVESSEARFAAALARARRASQISKDDSGWVRAQRFEIGWRALELAVLLGRGRLIADELVARFLEPDPTLLDGHFASVPMRIPAICARSSVSARCFARFRALRPSLPGAITEDTEAFLLGAERYARRDLAGAARAWRPLLAGRQALAAALPEAMVEVFERTGAVSLAELVDEQIMQRAGELHGATLAHARSARRAFARGERELALRLAEQVIAAWATADETPPALAELQRLAAAARKPAPDAHNAQ